MGIETHEPPYGCGAPRSTIHSGRTAPQTCQLANQILLLRPDLSVLLQQHAVSNFIINLDLCTIHK